MLQIINEEISKVYEDTEILSSFPELKEAVLKYNRIVEESFDDAQRIYDKTFKYNVSDIEKMQSDKKTIDEMSKELSELRDRFNTYAYQSPNISDDEQIEVENMLESVKKYLYTIDSLSDMISSMISKYEELKEELADLRQGNAPLLDINKFKIFVN